MDVLMRRSLILTLLFALCLPVASMAQSGLRTEGDVATASGSYEAEVPVNSQSDADRNGALARALGVVLGKLSGDRNVTARPGVVQALRGAKDYVASYDYKQDQSLGASGAPSYRTLLVARFRDRCRTPVPARGSGWTGRTGRRSRPGRPSLPAGSCA